VISISLRLSYIAIQRFKILGQTPLDFTICRFQSLCDLLVPLHTRVPNMSEVNLWWNYSDLTVENVEPFAILDSTKSCMLNFNAIWLCVVELLII